MDMVESLQLHIKNRVLELQNRSVVSWVQDACNQEC